jgi:hypothetical protein
MLKLAAIDEEDLAVVSAHAQDAVLKVGDMVYLPKERRFALVMNRFSWEKVADRGGRKFERRRALLIVDRVAGVRTSGIDREHSETVLELLAMHFEATEAPAGNVTLVFAGGGAVQLKVEVIEVRLADLGETWVAAAKPSHDLGEGQSKTGA